MNKSRLLIVDDEESMRMLLKTFFEGEKEFEVEFAKNGTSALVMIKEQAFDAIITDLKMPGMDGEELIAEINELDPSIVKIVFTGWGTLDSARKVMSLGCDDYLIKPLEDLNQLSFAVRKGLWRKKVLESHYLLEKMSKAKHRLFDDTKNEITAIISELEIKLQSDDLNSIKTELQHSIHQLNTILNSIHTRIADIHKEHAI